MSKIHYNNPQFTKLRINTVFIFFNIFMNVLAQSVAAKDTPVFVKKLIVAYPDFIKDYNNGFVIWNDGTKMLADDKLKTKSYTQLLENPSLKDEFLQIYPKGIVTAFPEKDYDPGRIRYEPFFLKMYGATQKEVSKHIVRIKWCPKLVGQYINVTSINGVDKRIKAISAELDEHPELKEYLKNIGGTFNWRKISGTNRQSTHSFGNTIDLNTQYANYWQWTCNCNDETIDLVKPNNTNKKQIPQVIIDIFEKNGFIWGGKWYHYDTMHFEYRPELL